MVNTDLLTGRYTLEDQIGIGGMGVVYRATDASSGHTVAIKLLDPESIDVDPDLIERFSREAEALRQLDHPNIVSVLDAGTDGDQYFLAMEYVPGGTLRELIDSGRPLEIAHALEIFLDLADALTRAHRLGIIHRDLKPSNVLLAADGMPRLTDFGLAQIASKPRLTQSGIIMGSVDYLSPETCRGKQASARSDIWSFGIMIFETLTGDTPFDAPNLAGTLTSILNQPPPDLESLAPDVPVGLVDLVYRMLEKDLTQRIPSVRMVGAELEFLLEEQSRTPRDMPAAGTVVHPTVKEIGRFDTPAGEKIRVRGRNLPVQATPFVGRQTELQRLAVLITDPQMRLVSVLGPGGMGKTRLALALAGEHLQFFEHGVYFVSLANLDTAMDVIPTLAESLGLRLYEGLDPEEQLHGFLEDKELLLLLDNFEHLLEGAEIVSRLLARSPGTTALITSREKLNLQGEVLFRLGGMDLPDPPPQSDLNPESTIYQETIRQEAVTLFLQGARRALGGFELEPAQLPVVIDICHQVGGSPLGILLAAAAIEIFSLEEISREIDQNLDFLESELRDIPERHRSIRAVFESSWTLLSETVQTVLANLSVFRGGFSRDAALAVRGANLRSLMAIANKSLLQRSPVTGRFDIHPLLSQYAAEKLTESGFEGSARKAHGQYFTQFMGERLPDILGARQIPARDEMTVDFDNIRSAWRWAVLNQEFAAVDESLLSLYVYGDVCSRYYDIEPLFRLAKNELASAPSEEPHPLLSLILLSWYDFRVQSIGHLDSTSELSAQAGQCLQAAKRRDDRRAIGCSLALQGEVAMNDRNLALAISHYKAALDHWPKLDEGFYISARIGSCYKIMGDLDNALLYYREFYDQMLKLGERTAIGYSLFHFGEIAALLGDYKEAESDFLEADRLFTEIQASLGRFLNLGYMGVLALIEGNSSRALDLIDEARDIGQANNFPRFYFRINLIVRGWIAVLNEDYQNALDSFEEVDAFGTKRVEPNVGLAIVFAAIDDYTKAKRHLAEALDPSAVPLVKAMSLITLPAAAIIFAHDEKHEQTVELLSLANSHPHSPKAMLESWPLHQRLLDDLHGKLSAAAFSSAWTEGQHLDIDSTISKLRATFPPIT